MKLAWSEVVTVDARALACFRIALGLLLLLDAGLRWPDREAHYADTGAVPSALVLAERPGPPLFRLFHLDALDAHGGSVTVPVALSAAAALALLLGWRTRIATAICFFLWCSWMARDPFVLSFGDRFLRVMLFWSLFLPLGAAVSLDARRASVPGPAAVRSWGSAGVLVQIVAIYVFSALLKNHPHWIQGEALQMAFLFDGLTRPLGRALLAWPELLRLLTWGTLVFEGLVVLLVFSPWRNALMRTAVVGMAIGFHLGIALTMRLGWFQLVCIVAWIPFLPGAFFDRLRFGQAARATGTVGSGALANGAAALALVLVLLVNADSLRADPALPGPVQALARWVGLDQRWSMFAPHPNRVDGWFVAAGRRADGSLVDLLRGEGAPRFSKPEGAPYANTRWLSYMVQLHVDRERSERKAYFAHYLCARHNRAHPENPVDLVSLDYIQELTRHDGSEDPPLRVKLTRRRCDEPLPYDG